jgi:hypothetical protein
MYCSHAIFTNGIVNTTNNTQSTSTTTGSLVTAGGLGVVKDAFIGGNLNALGNLTVSNNITDSSGTITEGSVSITSTTLGYLNSNVQLQINNATSNITSLQTASTGQSYSSGLTTFTGNVTAPYLNDIANSTLQYVNSLSSNAQTQINAVISNVSTLQAATVGMSYTSGTAQTAFGG